MRLRVTLVHPPQAKPCEPTPGVLALAGHLRRRGVAVTLVDANLEVQERLLEAGSLQSCVNRLEERGAARSQITSARRAVHKTSRALDALRRPRTYEDPVGYRAALDGLGEAYRALSRARGARISPSDFEHPQLSPLSTKDLLLAAREPDRVGLADELSAACESILRDDPGVVGVSVTYLSQALPSFALAGLLRRGGYRGRLVLGGGLATSWGSRLAPDSELFRIWDALVSGPGEGTLEGLAKGHDLTGVPGVLAPGLGAWNPAAGNRAGPVCFRPGLTALPWDRYLAPGPVVPLATTRGCYWRRCTFCPEAAQDRQPLRSASSVTLREAILRARDTVGASWVHLTDDAVPPSTLRDLARGLRGEGVRWYGFARPEQALLDPEFAEDLASGGCAMLQIGMETASQRLLDLMGKGTRAAHTAPILENLARAGVRTYVYLLFGIPSETGAEVQGTLDWAAETADSITFLNLALMSVPRGSPLEKDLAADGCPERADFAARLDLSLYRPREVGGGATPVQARRALDRARDHAALRNILARTPTGFTSNHAAFAPLPRSPPR